MTIDELIKTTEEQGTQSAVLLKELAEIVKQGGGGGGSVMLVNFTWPEDEEIPIADKTVKEVYEALKAGTRVFGAVHTEHDYEDGAISESVDTVFEFTNYDFSETSDHVEQIEFNTFTVTAHVLSDYDLIDVELIGYGITLEEEPDEWIVLPLTPSMSDYVRHDEFNMGWALPQGEGLLNDFDLGYLNGKYLTDSIPDRSGTPHTVLEYLQAIKAVDRFYKLPRFKVDNYGDWAYCKIVHTASTREGGTEISYTMHGYSYLYGTAVKVVFTLDDSVPVSVTIKTIKDLFDLYESN